MIRIPELRELDAAALRGGLLVVFGRRRVGKTRLLRQWMDGRGGMFSQALEGPVEMQVGQVFADVRDQLETTHRVRTRQHPARSERTMGTLHLGFPSS